ncbi:MAG: AAA-like domain-containing protein [Prochloraceae cyanobacterium]|nr:AAA-like domain-containing protein [Prochloraceae cyanobacterium]
MDEQKMLSLVNALTLAKRGKPLTEIEQNIIRGTWLGLTYKTIATRYKANIKSLRDPAAELWKMLSAELKLLGVKEDVNKSNFRIIIERNAQRIAKELGRTSLLESESMLITDSPIQNKTHSKSVAKEETFANISMVAAEKPLSPVKEACPQAAALFRSATESEFYVERIQDKKLREAISKPGAVVRIKAPKKRGKTLLVRELLSSAESYSPVYVNFELADRDTIGNLEKLLKWFSANVSLAMGKDNSVNECWDNILGAKTSCSFYFQNILLKKAERPIILALDKLELIFEVEDVAKDFFALLRAWHEKARIEATWAKIRLILCYREIPFSLESNRSPFNVGVSINLPDFSNNDVLELSKKYGLKWATLEAEKFTNTVGFHPESVREAFERLTGSGLQLEEFLLDYPQQTSLE